MDSIQTKPIIKSYNRLLVHNNLESLGEYIVDFDLAKKYQKYNDWNHGIIDRTGSMKSFLNIGIDSYVPKYIHNYKETFSSVTLKRAKELAATNKVINVLWSGGLDSMTILSAFYNLDIDPNQIVVILTHDSLYESGTIFEDIIYKRFKRYKLVQPPIDKVCNDIPDDEILLTGNHGNAIMNRVFPHIKENEYSNPYDMYLSKDRIDFYQPFIDAFPRKISTISEFYSYYSFNFNWNANTYMYYTMRNMNKKKIHIFFDTLDYQNYYISCDDDKYDKRPMRKFILSQLGDPIKTYVNTKKIRNSYTRNMDDWLFVTDDHRVIGNEIL
jgi:hypothetical protein